MTAAESLPFVIVDVFTSRSYAGNQLAVVFDADGLSSPAMQQIAREFNFAETTFVCTPTDPGADYWLRIFTPSTELPFAGHPSVGTAWAMRVTGRLAADVSSIRQQCGAGLLPLNFLTVDGDDVVRLQGGEPSVGDPVDPAPVLEAVGLTPDDAVDMESRPPRWCGAGIPFGFLRVRDDAVARCRAGFDAVAALGGSGVSVFSWDPQTHAVHARVFAAGAGVAEDAATGSAAIGLGFWLVTAGLVDPDGVSSYTVTQGVEMGRPSTLHGEVTARDGRPVSGTVAGAVAFVAEGRITPPAA